MAAHPAPPAAARLLLFQKASALVAAGMQGSGLHTSCYATAAEIAENEVADRSEAENALALLNATPTAARQVPFCARGLQ